MLAKRDKPRRNEGRIQHSRIKDKAGRPANAEEKRHHARIAKRGCLVCGMPSTLHHTTSNGFERLGRKHHLVVPLCPRHHFVQFGPRESVEALGHQGFRETYGINLLGEAQRLWDARND